MLDTLADSRHCAFLSRLLRVLSAAIFTILPLGSFCIPHFTGNLPTRPCAFYCCPSGESARSAYENSILFRQERMEINIHGTVKIFVLQQKLTNHTLPPFQNSDYD